MTRAHLNQLIATALAIAGIAGACAVLAVAEYEYGYGWYGYGSSAAAIQKELARERSAYERCVAEIRSSGEHQDFADLLIDAICPVRPSQEQARVAVSAAAEGSGRALRLAGAMLAFCGLPWVASRLSKRQRRLIARRS